MIRTAEPGEDDEHGQHDQHQRQAPPHAAAHEPADRRLEPGGQEEADEDQHEGAPRHDDRRRDREDHQHRRGDGRVVLQRLPPRPGRRDGRGLAHALSSVGADVTRGW
jgi:hypothetical protein